MSHFVLWQDLRYELKLFVVDFCWRSLLIILIGQCFLFELTIGEYFHVFCFFPLSPDEVTIIDIIGSPDTPPRPGLKDTFYQKTIIALSYKSFVLGLRLRDHNAFVR